MSSQNHFSLRIFIADGDPDGLRLVEIKKCDEFQDAKELLSTFNGSNSVK